MNTIKRITHLLGLTLGGCLFLIAMTFAAGLTVVYLLVFASTTSVAWLLFTAGHWVITGEWRCPVEFVFFAPVKSINVEYRRYD